MYDARVAVADRSVHGHEPRHRHRAAIDGETLLLPVELGEQAPEVRLAGGGIEDVCDEHEAVGQPHAQIMYAASGVDKELHEVERVPRPREAPGWRAPGLNGIRALASSRRAGHFPRACDSSRAADPARSNGETSRSRDSSPTWKRWCVRWRSRAAISISSFSRRGGRQRRWRSRGRRWWSRGWGLA